MIDRSVEDIIEGLRKDLNESFSKRIQLDRDDVEKIVAYFDDIDAMKKELGW